MGKCWKQMADGCCKDPACEFSHTFSKDEIHACNRVCRDLKDGRDPWEKKKFKPPKRGIRNGRGRGRGYYQQQQANYAVQQQQQQYVQGVQGMPNGTQASDDGWTSVSGQGGVTQQQAVQIAHMAQQQARAGPTFAEYQAQFDKHVVNLPQQTLGSNSSTRSIPQARELGRTVVDRASSAREGLIDSGATAHYDTDAVGMTELSKLRNPKVVTVIYIPVNAWWPSG
jgi:hypothetical protein